MTHILRGRCLGFELDQFAWFFIMFHIVYCWDKDRL